MDWRYEVLRIDEGRYVGVSLDGRIVLHLDKKIENEGELLKALAEFERYGLQALKLRAEWLA